MNDARPAPGSPWARLCPDAFPREWVTGGALPAGFARAATGYESDLIMGKMTEGEFLRRTGKAGTPSPAPATAAGPTARGKGRGKGKPSPVVKKLHAWNRFLDGLARREPKLHPLAVAVWCWLWKCEKDGLVPTSERKLAERFGVCRDNVRARLDELLAAGFLTVARHGVHGKSATVYRIRPTPKKPTSTADVNGLTVDDESDR